MRASIRGCLFVCGALVACGGSDSATPPSSGDASPDAPSRLAGGGPTLAMRAAAVTQTTARNATCTAIPAYYWEIGDASGPLASGAVGKTFSKNTRMDIASASKLVFGAYVVERFKDNLAMLDASAMRMLSGYVGILLRKAFMTGMAQ